MALSFCGVPLLLEDQEHVLQTWLERNLSLRDVGIVSPRQPEYEDCQNYRWAIPRPNWMLHPPAWKINTLWWPTGASRWAMGLFLCSTDQRDKILDGLDSNGAGLFTSNEENNLSSSEDDEDDTEAVENDDQRKRLETNLYALPFRHITGQEYPDDRDLEKNDLWILPLVDARYHWHSMPVPEDADFGDTWETLFAALRDALNIEVQDFILPDSDPVIPAKYGSPNISELGRPYQNAAMLLDAAAWLVNLRVVRDFDGKVILQTEMDSYRLSHTHRQRHVRRVTDTIMDELEIEATVRMSGDKVWHGNEDLYTRTFPAKIAVSFINADGTSSVKSITPDDISFDANEWITASEIKTLINNLVSFETQQVISYPSDAIESVRDDIANEFTKTFYQWKLDTGYDIIWPQLPKLFMSGRDDFVWYHFGSQHLPQWCNPKAVEKSGELGEFACYTRVKSLPDNFGMIQRRQGGGGAALPSQEQNWLVPCTGCYQIVGQDIGSVAPKTMKITLYEKTYEILQTEGDCPALNSIWYERNSGLPYKVVRTDEWNVMYKRLWLAPYRHTEALWGVGGTNYLYSVPNDEISRRMSYTTVTTKEMFPAACDLTPDYTGHIPVKLRNGYVIATGNTLAAGGYGYSGTQHGYDSYLSVVSSTSQKSIWFRSALGDIGDAWIISGSVDNLGTNYWFCELPYTPLNVTISATATAATVSGDSTASGTYARLTNADGSPKTVNDKPWYYCAEKHLELCVSPSGDWMITIASGIGTGSKYYWYDPNGTVSATPDGLTLVYSAVVPNNLGFYYSGYNATVSVSGDAATVTGDTDAAGTYTEGTDVNSKPSYVCAVQKLTIWFSPGNTSNLDRWIISASAGIASGTYWYAKSSADTPHSLTFYCTKIDVTTVVKSYFDQYEVDYYNTLSGGLAYAAQTTLYRSWTAWTVEIPTGSLYRPLYLTLNIGRLATVFNYSPTFSYFMEVVLGSEPDVSRFGSVDSCSPSVLANSVGRGIFQSWRNSTSGSAFYCRSLTNYPINENTLDRYGTSDGCGCANPAPPVRPTLVPVFIDSGPDQGPGYNVGAAIRRGKLLEDLPSGQSANVLTFQADGTPGQTVLVWSWVTWSGPSIAKDTYVIIARASYDDDWMFVSASY